MLWLRLIIASKCNVHLCRESKDHHSEGVICWTDPSSMPRPLPNNGLSFGHKLQLVNSRCSVRHTSAVERQLIPIHCCYIYQFSGISGAKSTYATFHGQCFFIQGVAVGKRTGTERSLRPLCLLPFHSCAVLSTLKSGSNSGELSYYYLTIPLRIIINHKFFNLHHEITCWLWTNHSI